jgi:hypothetical protein
MDAARSLPSEVSEPLTWVEIRARYPDETVLLAEMDHVHPDGSEWRTARVIGHGKTRREALDDARLLLDNYHLVCFRFTGISKLPLRRPVVILDDETREFFRYRW